MSKNNLTFVRTLLCIFTYIMVFELCEGKAKAATIVPGTEYYIVSCKDNLKCLDIANGSKATGANIQLYTSNGTGAQKFRITIRNGCYVITNVNSGKVLDVAGGSMVSGCNLWQYDSNGTAAQQWYLQNLGGDKYVIRSKRNNLVINLSRGSTGNGTNVNLEKYTGSSSQMFYLVPCRIKYKYVTVTYDCSSLNAWIKDAQNKNSRISGVIVSKTINSYKSLRIKMPYQGPGAGYYYGTIKLPQKVTYMVHTHENQMGFGKRWIYSQNGILIFDSCACGYRKDVMFWEFPDLPQKVSMPYMPTSVYSISSP